MGDNVASVLDPIQLLKYTTLLTVKHPKAANVEQVLSKPNKYKASAAFSRHTSRSVTNLNPSGQTTSPASPITYSASRRKQIDQF